MEELVNLKSKDKSWILARGSAKTKILFAIPDLYRGGAQRVFINLLKFFDTSVFDISLVVLIKSPEKNFRAELPSHVHVIEFNLNTTKKGLLPLLRLIASGDYKVVISTLTHMNLMMAFIKLLVRKKILYVARESNTLSSSLRNEKFPFLFSLFVKVFYRTFDLIICQSMAMAADLSNKFHIPRRSLRVIYNPVDIEHILSSIQLESQIQPDSREKVELLCVGRLYHQKGYDRLFKALTHLRDFPYRLRIIGTGVLEQELKKLAGALDLNESIEFLGVQENPFKFMKAADCLLLPSYYEGLPNVVLEANVCGLPVIAFNSPGGTSEIVVNGLNGWLVEDGNVIEFASLIKSREYQKLDRKRITAFAQEGFSLRKITSQYEDAISSLLQSST